MQYKNVPIGDEFLCGQHVTNFTGRVREFGYKQGK